MDMLIDYQKMRLFSFGNYMHIVIFKYGKS